MTPTPRDVAVATLGELHRQADPQRAARTRYYFKETVACFGLTSPQVRELTATLWAEVRREWRLPQAIALCEMLLPEPQLEAKSVATLILQKFRREFTPALLPVVHNWLARDLCANWASVDLLCPDTVGVVVDRHPDAVAGLLGWSEAENMWVRRAAAVSLVKLARHGRHLDAAYDISLRLLPAPEDLLHKATGWLLREAGKTDPDRLDAFLRRHGPAIPRTAVRYAIEKFPAARRQELLAVTRGG